MSDFKFSGDLLNRDRYDFDVGLYTIVKPRI